MALQYYQRISQTNTTDLETFVEDLASTVEEPKKIVSLMIQATTNNGILRLYKERDNFAVIPTDGLPVGHVHEILIDLELPVGETFSYTLQNVSAGSNAVLKGVVRYEITK